MLSRSCPPLFPLINVAFSELSSSISADKWCFSELSSSISADKWCFPELSSSISADNSSISADKWCFPELSSSISADKWCFSELSSIPPFFAYWHATSFSLIYVIMSSINPLFISLLFLMLIIRIYSLILVVNVCRTTAVPIKVLEAIKPSKGGGGYFQW